MNQAAANQAASNQAAGDILQLASSESTTIESAWQSSWHLPLWVWLLYSACALSFALWIYWSERGNAGPIIRAALATLRFGLLMAVLWMLAGWNWLQYRTEKPELAIVVDRSASMNTRDIVGSETSQAGAESSRWEAARDLLLGLTASQRKKLLGDYQLRYYALADNLETVPPLLESSTYDNLSPTGEQSKLGENLSQVIERHAGRGAAAIIFISDGINTAGPSLQQAERMARSAAIPIQTLIVGRDLMLPDVRLADLLMDREVYFGDRVSAEVALVASDIDSAQVTVTLREAESDRKLDEQQVTVSPNNERTIVNLSFVPEAAGEIALKIEASAVDGESDLENNSLTQSVMVRDKTLRVLLVQQQPSYEFRFLKHLLERSQQAGQSKSASFELLSVLQEADAIYTEQDPSALRLVPSDAETLADIDVFIFGPLNPELISRRSQRLIYESVTEGGAGCVFVYGSGSPADELAGWPLADLLPVAPPQNFSGNSTWDNPLRWQPSPLGLAALPLQLSSTPQQSLILWSRLPGFVSMCDMGDLKVGAQVLAVASSRDANEADRPLLITQYAGAGRVALQATDETFRWTSFSGSDTYHQRYWGQLLRWISRGKLQVTTDDSTLIVEPQQAKLGQSLRFEAQIGLEVAQENLPQEVILSLTNERQSRSTISLARSTRSSRTYRATFNNLEPGTYRALLVQPATQAPPSQEFSVIAPPGEQTNLRADLPSMQSLAAVSRGRFYTLSDAERIFDELPKGKATRLDALPPQPLWNRWWVAFLFVLAITLEWLLRRKARML
ncbi:MAG: hypothetical protein NXI32_05180 [bacterium]|nr:hypothetical protein [bacterium]